jgi:two-component system sensor histidine kinase PilS (NtrC family)
VTADLARLLRLLAWARLGATAVVVILLPLVPADFRPEASPTVLAVVLATALASSLALLLVPPARPGRAAALVCFLDVVLVTALVAATGGPRSIYTFFYVLGVTGACLLLPRAGALAVAGAGALLYAGLVIVRTVLPLTTFLEAPGETSALEVLSIFLNAATLLAVAVLASGLAQRYHATRRELEAQAKDLQDLQAFRTVILNSTGTGLIALDREYRITALNPAAGHITGLVPDEVLGRPWAAVLGEAVAVETLERETAGRPGSPNRYEATIARPDGRRVTVRFTFSTLRSSTGARLGMIVVCEDLTEIRTLERRMRQADRLATLGRLAANMAHEIRNPLASMTGAVEALAGQVSADERERLAQIVARESARLNAIITEFLDYARPVQPVKRQANVADILDEVLTLLGHRELPPGLKIVREFAPSLSWPVDGQQLRQALWNLCLNAVEAMPAGGELTVAAAVRDGQLAIEVADTGDGIPPADLPHLFEPFFSTKPGGTGLGLAMVHRIVQDHGGEVSVDSVPGRGTRVVVRLPDTVHA